MFAFRANQDTLAELERVRNELSDLKEQVASIIDTDEANSRRIAAAVRSLADAIAQQVSSNETTTAVVLGLMRVIQHEFGHEKIGITPFGSDPGKLT